VWGPIDGTRAGPVGHYPGSFFSLYVTVTGRFNSRQTPIVTQPHFWISKVHCSAQILALKKTVVKADVKDSSAPTGTLISAILLGVKSTLNLK
jgi:hypothetical protein